MLFQRLEKTISETKHTIDNICEECGSIVPTNESLQLIRKMNTADVAVINRVADHFKYYTS